MAVKCQQREQHHKANTVSLSDNPSPPTEPQPSPSSRKRKIKPVWGNKNKSSHVSLVWRCWVLGVGVMWCCAVMSPLTRVSIYLLHAYKQWEEDICCSRSTTLHSFHFIQYSYPFPLLGETTLHLRIDSWFYQTPIGGLVRPFCSFLE